MDFILQVLFSLLVGSFGALVALLLLMALFVIFQFFIWVDTILTDQASRKEFFKGALAWSGGFVLLVLVGWIIRVAFGLF